MPASQTDLTRCLGLLFAGSDCAFELGPDGVIAYAIGATERAVGAKDAGLVGRSWRTLFDPDDHGVIGATIETARTSGRAGPVHVHLLSRSCARKLVALSACALPQLAPNISCSLGPVTLSSGPGARTLDREGFEAAAARVLRSARETGLSPKVALVQLAGFTHALAALSQTDAGQASETVTGLLQCESIGGRSMAQLGPEIFALMSEGDHSADLASKLNTLAQALKLDIAPRCLALNTNEADPKYALRAMRFALDQFMAFGVADDGANLLDAFQASLGDTVERARSFIVTAKERKFDLVYQPVASLRSGAPSHYEVLSRFPGAVEPFATIRMAEELEIIETFDLAVAARAIDVLKANPPSIKLAVNLSGRSFLQPRFMDRLFGLTAGDVRLKGRLIFEITESAALTNLDLAEERIQRLRREGYQVCLDDFGAGAASFSYLRSLTVDTVKIDGLYIRQLRSQDRDGVLVRHLVQLCKELKINTIAEMVEDEETKSALITCGVDFAQGYLLGRPGPLPEWQDPREVRPARRMGAVESWG
jgi:EAL domain-containing protein (putative c-di-GMP-specific phosphodiesterase class I)